MMTTDRTSIRRRLAVRRRANRPPWRGRKAGHRSIVAPLAATRRGDGRGERGGGRRRGARQGRARPPRSASARSASARLRAAGRRAAGGGAAAHGARPARPRDRAAGRPGRRGPTRRPCTRRARRSSACARCCGCSRPSSGAQRFARESAALRDVAGAAGRRARREVMHQHAGRADRAPPAQARPPARRAGRLRAQLARRARARASARSARRRGDARGRARRAARVPRARRRLAAPRRAEASR